MLFNSLDYILFLGIAVAGFWLLARHAQARIIFIFVLSCLFYMAWHPAYIVLILGSTLIDYVVGLRIHASEREKTRKRWLIVSLVSNLGLLGVFKYFNFASQATADVLAALFRHRDSETRLSSTSSCRSASPSIRSRHSATRSTSTAREARSRPATSFSSHCSSRTSRSSSPVPSSAPSELLPQLQRKITLRDEQVTQGLFLIATGMVKKVAIADYLSVNLVDRVFDQPELYTGAEVVIALYGFTMQIYCDFSGYTDVARGSAKLMGLELPRNFDRPYQSSSPAEFWRRWHMTLSTWLRDYLYFPLGGSHTGPVRAYWNLSLTMFLIGIWHGASWTFVVYALLQSMAMVTHRFSSSDRAEAVTRSMAGNCTHSKCSGRSNSLVFSRILFRATSLQNAADVTARLGSGTFSVAQISLGVWAMLVLTFAAHYTPKRWFESIELNFKAMPAPAQGIALAVVGFVLSVVATSEVVPYIYFQF